MYTKLIVIRLKKKPPETLHVAVLEQRENSMVAIINVTTNKASTTEATTIEVHVPRCKCKCADSTVDLYSCMCMLCGVLNATSLCYYLLCAMSIA